MTNMMIVAGLMVAMIVSPTLSYRYRYPSYRQEVENEWFQNEGEGAENEWFHTEGEGAENELPAQVEGIVTSLMQDIDHVVGALTNILYTDEEMVDAEYEGIYQHETTYVQCMWHVVDCCLCPCWNILSLSGHVFLP